MKVALLSSIGLALSGTSLPSVGVLGPGPLVGLQGPENLTSLRRSQKAR